MKAKHENIEDFLNDPDFRQWILKKHPAELESYWAQWLAENPEKKSLYRQAETLLQTLEESTIPLSAHRQERMLQGIRKGIHQNTVIRKNYSWVYGIAACLLALFLFFLAGDQFYINRPGEKSQFKGIQWTSLSNTNERIRQIRLPDGSQIILHRESKIRYRPNGFGEQQREIHLEGEAFFEVAKNPDVPFRVHSDSVITTALGTSFSIRSYSGLPFRVQLATGKVSVIPEQAEADGSAKVILRPGQEALRKNKQHFQLRRVAVQEIAAWKKGLLIFNQTPFPDAVSMLERWYDVHIQVKNLKERQHYINGAFQNETLENTLKSIQFALGFDYRINGNQITITFN